MVAIAPHLEDSSVNCSAFPLTSALCWRAMTPSRSLRLKRKFVQKKAISGLSQEKAAAFNGRF